MKIIAYLIITLLFSNIVSSQTIQNGGFENGYTGWNAYSQASDHIVGTASFFESSSITPSVTPRSGTLMARLGGFSYNTNYLSQIVTLPNANPVKLELYFQTRSSTTSECAGIWVGAKVNVFISGSSIYEAYLCNYNDLYQWTYGYFDLTAAAGQQVEIKFSAEAANSVWSYIYFDDIVISPATTDINSPESKITSNIEQNYPNPFSEVTSINYSLKTSGKTNLKVFNQYGKEIFTVFDEYKTEGDYTCNICGLNLSDGIYYYKLTTDGKSIVKKMIVIK